MPRHSGFCSAGPGGVNGETDLGDCVVLLLLRAGKHIGPERVSTLARERPVEGS